MGQVEVEAKYPLGGDIADWRQRLLQLGARPAPPERQCDEYFAHPARDFAATGEAFRIRSAGEANTLTYKGPLIDPQTKTRSECEVRLAAGPDQAARMTELLHSLGFRSAGRVDKTRTCYALSWRGYDAVLALDEVDGLGPFLELEIVSDEARWTAARDALLELAATLGLENCERRSYLELLRGSVV